MPEKLSKKEFYNKYYPIVQDSVKGTGLYPETVIAQMAIESGWGGSGLTKKHNNFFGIKSHGKSGGVEMGTEEEVDGKRVKQKSNFRTYNSPEDSIKDYVKFLKNNPRYKKAGVFNAKTPEAQAEALQRSGYSTSSNYGKAIKQTISANKDKTNVMSKNKNYRSAVGDLKSKKEEIAYLKKVGKNKEAKQKQDELNQLVAGVVYAEQRDRRQKLENDLKSAEENKDWSTAIKLADDIETFDKNSIDFGKTKDKLESVSNITIDESGKMRGYGSRVVKGGKELDLDFDKIYNVYESTTPQEEVVEDETNNLPEQPDSPEETYSDPNANRSGNSSKEVSVDVDDLPKGDSEGSVGEITGDDRDYAAEYEKAQQDLMDFQNYSGEQFVHDYAPDSQPEGDFFENLMDAGRGVMGFIGASKEVPEYERGSMFSEAMSDAQRMKDQGLSQDELNYRKGMAERGYHYDIKNIRRLAGGSAGVALGNLGRAQSQLQDQYGEIAATDEAMRRQNRQNFQSMSLRDEAINRQIFEDELRQTEMTKQSGSAMIQDAIRNIQDRKDFNRQFGKGSPYYEYQKSLDRDMQESMFDRRKGNERRMKQTQRELEFNVNKSRENYEKNNTLDGDENPIIEKQNVATEQPKENPLNMLNEYEETVDENGSIFRRGFEDIDDRSEGQKESDKLTEEISAKKKSEAPKKRYEMLLEAREFGGLGDDDEAEFQKLKKDYNF